ncbi:stage III sporulation protein AA [Anaerobranca californiensis DSM 14826]|jgi:stage III sporulation protein AA|uniref:Stage III sporulation protein AA n=1 Tax=Anaerobranca californiensis DSM 14826 TaxID=1120989 RepID=A0A1M6L7V5_9FIRM|nr:stage III sporulation protein AA [Anaerobranca californiensis]SHJ67286.1 stage III sporulation protein AA [Anaerobranca californiensis DSM 14826]
MEKIIEQILPYFPPEIKEDIIWIFKKYPNCEEIRVRVNKPLSFFAQGREGATNFLVDKGIIEKIFYLLTNYSYYSVEEELQKGYITIPGGHRVGICGKAVVEKEKVKTLVDINSLNIRIARQKKGIGDKVLPYIIKDNIFLSTIILSPPNCGKTTLLRDLVRILSSSDKFSFKVGVVDERSEIAGCFRGIPQLDIGKRVDVIDSCPKKEGMIMLIRSMSPHILATDELGKKEDIDALEYAITAGVNVLTTVHGKDLFDLKNKGNFREILSLNLFKRLIILSNKGGMGTIEDIIDLETGRSIWEGKYYVV